MISGLSFVFPWALAGLAALPLVWWLLRVTPPAPKRQIFPPMRLLMRLVGKKESAETSPPWLLILRLLLLAALIVGASGPVWNTGVSLGGSGPVVMILDDGWAAVRNWEARRDAALRLLNEAEQAGRAVVLVTTAPETGETHVVPAVLSPRAARAQIIAHQPKPWATDRAARVAPLFAPGGVAEQLQGKPPTQVVWITDGVAEGNEAEWLAQLKGLGLLAVQGLEITPPLILRAPKPEGEALRLDVDGLPGHMPSDTWVTALGDDGRPVTRLRLEETEAGRLSVRVELPSEHRNRLDRLELDGAGSAAAVVLLDERWARRPIGILTDLGDDGDQPLLSEAYYVERALAPFAEIRRGGLQDLLQRPLAVLVLADSGRLAPPDWQRIDDWIAGGGLLLRFGGPNLATLAGTDDAGLLPVQLRAGGRAIGGALSWETPAQIAPFDAESPFNGLSIPEDVRIKRQLLAQPSLELDDRTWARLTDGTPLVTARRSGEGWVVLIHTTANAAWSNLALSGLFVEMLQRLKDLAQGVRATDGKTALPAERLLDAFGRLMPARPDTPPLPAGGVVPSVGPELPPGYYGSGDAARAINLGPSLAPLRPFGPLPEGATKQRLTAGEVTDYRPWFWGLALILALMDLIAGLWLRGLLGRGRRLGVGIVAGVLFWPGMSSAADINLAAANDTRLAYLRTGDERLDRLSEAGLRGLSLIAKQRTAAELAEPFGIDPETDELAFYPILYWPVTDLSSILSDQAAERINAYLERGGMILFDARNPSGAGGESFRRLSEKIRIPALVQVPTDHVLRRSFYLLETLPGRWVGSPVWVERGGEATNDGVSPVVVGANDWIGAWAVDDVGQPLMPVTPGGDRQREHAYRFGINLVMYALTGNYKGDQVHLPDIMRRLGRPDSSEQDGEPKP